MKLLVAMDGSKQSDEAVRSVHCFSPDSQVVLVHAIDPVRFYSVIGFDVPIVYSKETEQRTRDEGRRMLERAAKAAAPLVVTKRLEVGLPAEVILAVAGQEQADVILLGARGLGPIEELVFGSVSHQVLAQAPCPVLVVRHRLSSVRRVLAPVEMDEDADRLMRFLAGHPFREAPEIRFLTIGLIDRALAHALPDERETRQSIMERAREVAHRFGLRARDLGYPVTDTALLGTPADAILEEAESARSDLILLATRGRSALSRFLLGSVGHTLLHRAHQAVLVVRGTPSTTKGGTGSLEETTKAAAPR